EQGIIGIVMISVEIYPNGTIANISLLRRSQYKLLNDYSKVLLRRASPFTPFADDECFKDKDILSITRSFYFEATKGFQNRAAE
ncbi:MAG: energy transducer TonB, partial [Pseudomonadota bacterium]